MRQIRIPRRGSAAGSASSSDVSAEAAPDESFFRKAMDTKYELWWLTLEDPDVYQLAYVQPTVRRVDGRMEAWYTLHFATCTDRLPKRDWEALKERGRQTDALAEAGPEGVHLMQLAVQDRIPYTEAVRQIADRAQRPA